VQRNDFKLETLSPHLFMNLRVVDEHGRQLGSSRDLASLKAELGGQARSAAPRRRPNRPRTRPRRRATPPGPSASCRS
jgi:ATP-dependent helicase HrpA